MDMESRPGDELNALETFAKEQRLLGVPEPQVQAMLRELGSSAVPAGTPVASGVRYVGGWARFGSGLIDGIIIWVLNSMLMFLSREVYYLLRGFFLFNFFLLEMFMRYVGVAGMLYLALTVGRSGQTVGKLLLGQRVVRADFSPLGYGRAFLRYTVGYFVSGVVFGFGFFAILFNKRKQGWHDRIAGSVVIATR